MPIIKSKTHRSSGAYKGILEYVLRKDAQFKKDGKTFLFKHNILGEAENIGLFTKQFKENLRYRKVVRKDNINVLHEIISFHPKESSQISIGVLEDFTKHYVKLRNPLGMYIATAHRDKDHLHIHVIASPLELLTGKSMRMSKKEYSGLQQQLQLFQKRNYPFLDHSVIEYGKAKKKLNRLEEIRNIRSNR